jgi:LysM repeat protein
MFGLTKGAMLAIGAAASTAAVGTLAYRVWQAAEPAPIAASTAPTTSTAPAASAAAPAIDKLDHPQPAQSAAAPPQAPQPVLPGFDVVRVEPSGDTVVAGRAEPNADVALLDRGKVIGETKADANGQFAFIPPRLPAGDHLLALGQKSGSGQVMSAQTVTVAVPKKQEADGVVVALTEPDRPTKLLSDAAKPAAAAAKPQTSAETPPIAIRTVEMEERGGFFASGSAAPGAEVKLYLNGSAMADLHAGPDGNWSLQVAKGMQPGAYAVRADEIDAASGKVVARAEVPFDYKAFTTAENDAGQTAPADSVAAKDSTPARDASPHDAVIAAIGTVTVVHGDSLWRISRKVLGRGIRYTQIYAANASQIRDPALIYPGQVLVKPQTSVN